MTNPLKKNIILAISLSLSLATLAENRLAVLGDSDKSTLSVDLWGGAFVNFKLADRAENPFSWNIPPSEMPENNRAGAPFQGHFLCLGRWGAPTNGEIQAGIPHNGQPGNSLWNVIDSTENYLHIRSEAPLDGMTAERFIYLDAENAVFKVTDYVKNTLATGRLFNVVQHATLGVPFLSNSTLIDSNARWGFMQHLSYPNPHAYEYVWPNGVLDSLRNEVDLRKSDTSQGYVSTHLFNENIGWITAASPSCGLLIGYVWSTKDYPWLNVWHDVKSGKPYAKGLEFGTTGIGLPYQDLLEGDTRFHGKKSFFFLDALESVEKSFICFQVAIPTDYKGVERIEMKDGKIVLTEKGNNNTRSIYINNKFVSERIILSNKTKKDREDEPFVIKRSEFEFTESGKWPLLKDKTGQTIVCQADDLDKDGLWDELAFVRSLKSGLSDTLFVEWTVPELYPVFKSRTNVRHGKMLSPGNIVILSTDVHGKYNLPRGVGYPYQTDGPAWENDKVGFRHYFDGRNVRDIFGKRTTEMVMDTVGIQTNGTPGDTYHGLNWWGRDIMSGGTSVGLGGLAVLSEDSLIRLGVTIQEKTDNVDSTRYTLIVKGPVRSIFKLNFYGWDILGEKVDVDETMTIWAGKYGYENAVRTSSLPKGCQLVVGMVNSNNDQPYVLEKRGKYRLMSTHDRQTYDKTWYLGMSLLIAEQNFINTFEAPRSGAGITTTWCARLKPDKQGLYHFNCYAGWELSDERFTDSNFYHDMIRNYANELNEKLSCQLIK